MKLLKYYFNILKVIKKKKKKGGDGKVFGDTKSQTGKNLVLIPLVLLIGLLWAYIF